MTFKIELSVREDDSSSRDTYLRYQATNGVPRVIIFLTEIDLIRLQKENRRWWIINLHRLQENVLQYVQMNVNRLHNFKQMNKKNEKEYYYCCFFPSFCVGDILFCIVLFFVLFCFILFILFVCLFIY